MHCQICLSSELPSLLDMRDQFFMFKDQRTDLLSCYSVCKQIKFENAKICESCQSKLIAEYISKYLKSEASINEEQSMIPIADIKEEPNSNLGSEWMLKNDTVKICDLANEIVVSKEEIKTEAVLYQIIFPEHEIKQEPELQIDDENMESGQEIKTGAGVTIDNTSVTETVTTVPENHQKSLLCHIEATHKCSHCEKKFKTSNKLNRHQLTHIDTKTYHCNQSQCTAAFKTQTYLKRHMKTVHSGEKLKCLYCVKIFKSMPGLASHMETHSDTKKYQCKDCSEAFNTKSKLKIHFQNTHSISHSTEEFQCHYCSVIKNSKEKINRHVMCHVEATHTCSHCEKKFKTLSILVKHQLTHLDTKTYRCNQSQCAAAFKTQLSLYAHVKYTHSSEKLKCLSCDKIFKSKAGLAYHMETHSDIKKYQCKDCSEAFCTRSKLKIHFKYRHSISHSMEEFQCHYCLAIKNSREKIRMHLMCHVKAIHKCSHCEKKYTTLSLLVRHQLTHVDTKIFLCNQSQCTAAFKTQTYLKNHMINVHSSEKFKCLYCVKIFKSKPGLASHMETHSDIKKKQCKDCSEAFNTKSKLKIHFQNTHSMEKFKCHYCSTVKSSKEQIRMHLMLTHVDTKNYHCNQCAASFKIPKYLKIHMKTVHSSSG